MTTGKDPKQNLDPDLYSGQDVPATQIAKADSAENELLELLKAMLVAAVIAVGIRTFLFEPFNIPSASMYPTLLVGDYLFVEKYSYGYSHYSFPLDPPLFKGRVLERPVTRGDIAVFRQPMQPKIDYIKRIVGVPGDRIEMREGLLYINGKVVPREYLGTEQRADGVTLMMYQKYRETLPNGRVHMTYEISDTEQLDNTPVYTVPEGYYFAMGDNRDASQDSRVEYAVGMVPAENLIGRAAFIFFSIDKIDADCSYDGPFAGVQATFCKLAAVPKAIRYNRLFMGLHGV